jgi:hypothetical protein
LTEAEYLGQVYELAGKAGVLVHHCEDSRRCHGKGFPDLVLIGAHGLLLREVKASPGDRPRPEQTGLLWLLKASGQDARIWNYDDLKSGTVAYEIGRIS